METPADVLIHNEQLNLKGAAGRLLFISPTGYYEVNISFGDRRHRVLLPIGRTVVIAQEPQEVPPPPLEIER